MLYFSLFWHVCHFTEFEGLKVETGTRAWNQLKNILFLPVIVKTHKPFYICRPLKNGCLMPRWRNW
jgi:hypothetical protein